VPPSSVLTCSSRGVSDRIITDPSLKLAPNMAGDEGSSGGGRVFGGLLAKATFKSADGGGVKRLDKDSAPASAGTARSSGTTESTRSDVAKKVQLGAGYSQMDWMRLTKRDPDLAGLKGASRKRKISIEEVALHKTEEDGWTVFKGKVYNIAPYLGFHPGGKRIMISIIGKDCTAHFNKYHAWINGAFMMEKCQVGVLDTHVQGSDDEDSEDEDEDADSEGGGDGDFSFRT